MVTLVQNGEHYQGRSAESIVRRIYGRRAQVERSADRNNPRPVMAVRRDRHGTHVLGEFAEYAD